MAKSSLKAATRSEKLQIFATLLEHSYHKQELIKYKGNQVSPVELESVILQHPAVIDVGVVGVRLSDGNELPRAFVVSGRDSKTCQAQDILDWVKSLLSDYKQLRGGVTFVHEIPRNLNGKIMRDILNEWVTKEQQQQKDQSSDKRVLSAKL